MTMRAANPGAIFALQADSGRTAVVDLTGSVPREVSYAEMASGCTAVARGLVRAGFGPGTRVGLASGNRTGFYEVFFGAMLAGCVPLPFNIRLADGQFTELVSRNDADIVFADPDASRRLAEHTRQRTVVFDDDYADFVDAGEFAPVDVPDRVTLLQPFTSGTTGLPKGMVLSAGAVRWALRQMLPAGRVPDPSVTVTVAHPLYHKNAMLGSKGAFLNGGRVVMMDRFEPRRFVAAIGTWGVTKVHTVPTMMARIMSQPDLLAGLDQRHIREVHMGSAPVSQRLFDEVRAAFPGANIRVSYGVTEAGPMQFGEHPEGKGRPARSVGHRLPEVELRLVGGATQDEGMLMIRSPGVMEGYYGLPEETAKRLDTEGWYSTGDIFRRDADGFYFFVGRNDDMFVVNGNNLYPATVEETLLRHPDVAAAAVVPVEDEMRGALPVAFVVLRQGASTDATALKAHCIATAPAWQHPRQIHCLAELPVAGTGKVDVAGLRQIAAAAWRAAVPS
jgi:acyl-CoA synthetase (AMP-forming)/AMP-acid ligase II